MIDFRYHIVSIVAIFIALAVGIVLGSGPLKDDISGFLEARTDQLASQKVELQGQIDVLRNDIDASEQYAALTAPALLNTLLLTQPVALIELPNAAEDAGRRVQEAIELAGGSVASRVRLEPAWTDAAEIEVLDRIAEGLAREESDDTYDLAAQLLADALVTDVERLAGQPEVNTLGILTAFEERGFLKADAEEAVLASSAIVIGSDSTSETESQALLPVVDRIDARGEGTVVAGPLASASEGGIIFLVRDGDLAELVSTEDRVDTAIGTTVTVLALVDERNDIVGHFGTGEGAQSVAPDPIPTN